MKTSTRLACAAAVLFIAAPAVVPMKLFTIFTSDARALDHIARERSRIDAVLKRVTNHLEWGVRVVLDRPNGVAPTRRSRNGRKFHVVM